MTKYRLVKDLPGVPAGSIIEPTSALAYGYIEKGAVHLEWDNSFVQSNPQWFEKVNDRIEVVSITEKRKYADPRINETYICLSSSPIPEQKFPLLKKTIEYALNGDDRDYENYLMRGEYNKKYTQQDLEDAFNEAINICEPLMRRPLVFNKNDFFKNYLNTINK